MKYFSFNKFSLIKGKKYKNAFKRIRCEIFTDDSGEEYITTKNGTIYKRYDELSV